MPLFCPTFDIVFNYQKLTNTLHIKTHTKPKEKSPKSAYFSYLTNTKLVLVIHFFILIKLN